MNNGEITMSEDHNSKGRFKKGNQAGSRSKRSKEVVAYIKSISNDLQDYIDILDSIVRNNKTTNKDKVACVRELLDRSMGKPQQHNVNENHNTELPYSKVVDMVNQRIKNEI